MYFLLASDPGVNLFKVLPCVILFLSSSPFSIALRLPRLGKRELILVLFVRLFDLHLFGLPIYVWEGLWLVIVALPGVNRNTKRTEKHKNKMTHGKIYNKSPRRTNQSNKK